MTASNDDARIGELTAKLDGCTATIAHLKHEVDRLAAAVAARTERPPIWDTLDAAQTKAQLAALTCWADQLIDRYQLSDVIPRCWPTHPPIVEELAALRAAWLGAYVGPGGRPTDAIVWHDALHRVLTRIRSYDRLGCANAGAHREEQAGWPAQSRAEQLSDRAAHIAADIRGRPSAVQ